MGSVRHTPKAGATLTGTEYEAADHHLLDIDAADVSVADGGGNWTADDLEGVLEEIHSQWTNAVSGHVNDSADAHNASAISIEDTGGDFTATDVEGALAELESEKARIYIQAGDPGAVGAGVMWFDTSNNLFIRNTANDAWLTILSGD